MNKNNKIYLILIVIVILVIAGIYAYQSSIKEDPEEELLKCIAKNTDMLYLSKTCSHCQNQKKTLGEYFSLFKTIDCFYEIDKCKEADISGYPTWIINGKKYTGEKSIEELKQITGCECDITDETIKAKEECADDRSCINAIESSCSSNLTN
ncbi:hypothetical protein GOV12_01770 [Candidatus Pacearchaeota archaeon]|nr:hypothetical protein [Candidatus Pacearchaeota archaeon]